MKIQTLLLSKRPVISIKCSKYPHFYIKSSIINSASKTQSKNNKIQDVC